MEQVFRVSELFYKLLMTHQKVALKWLLKQHLTEQGSFLADEMGLGKTISAIALLVTLLSTDIYERGGINNEIRDPVLIVCPATVI